MVKILNIMKFEKIKFKIIKIKNGNINILERKKLPFDVKRVYYINATKKHFRQGHAHKKLNQIYISLYGSIDIDIFDGKKNYKVKLSHKSPALFIKENIWRQVHYKNVNSILLVLCSDIFKKNDYIRSKKSFLKYINNIKKKSD